MIEAIHIVVQRYMYVICVIIENCHKNGYWHEINNFSSQPAREMLIFSPYECDRVEVLCVTWMLR